MRYAKLEAAALERVRRNPGHDRRPGQAAIDGLRDAAAQPGGIHVIRLNRVEQHLGRAVERRAGVGLIRRNQRRERRPAVG